VYCPAGPVVSTGALTEAPLIVAEPTVHEDPSGPVTSIGFAGSVTASSNVNVTCVGALDRDAPSAGSLLFSSVCAQAGEAVTNTAKPANSTDGAVRRIDTEYPFR